MKPLSKEIFNKYQIRKTYQQKTKFIEYLTNYFNQNNIPYKIEQKGKTRNIIVGNINDPTIIYTAHYDTQAAIPFPNFITPLNWSGIILYNLFIILLFYITTIFLGTIIQTYIVDHPLIYPLLLYFLLSYMFIGKANKHTANDNTSGVITLLEIIQNIDRYDDVCFVFFDLEELGLIGSKQFHKSHPNLTNITLINFDCVSDGDYYLFKLNKHVDDKEFKDIIQDKNAIITKKGYYPSDQLHFDQGIGCAALHKKGPYYYLGRIHTKRDIIFKEENIEWFTKTAISILENRRKKHETRK